MWRTTAGAFVLLSTNLVLADEDPRPPTQTAPDTASTTSDTGVTARYPGEVINRPLTLPRGLLLAGGDVVAFNTVTVDLTNGTTSSSLGMSADIALGYGVTDDLEVNTITPTYAFGVKDFEIKGSFDVGIGYKLLRGAAGGKLELIARAVLGYDTLGEALRPLRVGVQAQYNVTPKICIVSHDIGVGNAGLSFALDGDPKPIFGTLPIGVGFQATPQIYIELDTSVLTTLELSNSATVSIADITPVALTLVYNTMARHLDVLAYAGFGDVQNAGDTYNFGIGARYYAGSVD